MEYGALILIGGFLVLLFLHVPIAFCMGFSSLAYLLYSGMPVTVLSQRLAAGLNSFPLLAVPLYIFVGQMMNSATMSQRIFDFCAALSGHIRGGLAHVNILNSMIFAGISGTAVADAASLGGLEIKIMREQGYDPAFSAAVTAASATIAHYPQCCDDHLWSHGRGLCRPIVHGRTYTGNPDGSHDDGIGVYHVLPDTHAYQSEGPFPEDLGNLQVGILNAPFTSDYFSWHRRRGYDSY